MSNSAAGAISIRPEAAGTASGAMGFLQMGIGSLVSQFGAYLGGHFSTPVPLNIAIVILSIACASTMIFLVPRRNVVVSEELIEKAEEEESGMLYGCWLVIASEAKQSRGRQSVKMDCFVALLLAMTRKIPFTPRSASATRLPSARRRRVSWPR
jgi:hypothetical protein